MRSSILILAAGLLAASTALAGELPALKKQRTKRPTSRTVQRVRAEVVQPMNQQFERRFMFSRARVSPPKRNVQTLARRADAAGRAFVPFKVVSEARARKVRSKGKSGQDVLAGCYYPADDAVYLEHGAGAVLASQHPRLKESSKARAEAGRCVPSDRALSAL